MEASAVLTTFDCLTVVINWKIADALKDSWQSLVDFSLPNSPGMNGILVVQTPPDATFSRLKAVTCFSFSISSDQGGKCFVCLSETS